VYIHTTWIPPALSVRHSVCPVTDPGLLAFQFTLHTPTQTNIYAYALWISPVTVPRSSGLCLTHAQRCMHADRSQLTPAIMVSPVTGLNLLVPPGTSQALVSPVSSPDLRQVRHMAPKPLTLLTSYSTLIFAGCTH